MISVIMPVYNGESHLKEAIDSILNQTYRDFQFLIINDGSTDRSEEIIQSYVDDRIKYIVNESNLGIVKTLNKGIDLATFKYIARMDADDIALPHRFEKQIEFMEANPDTVACGSNIIKFYNDDINQTSLSDSKLLDKDLKIRTLFYTAFWHPTMLIRSKILNEHNIRYRTEYKYAQDKAMWIDIAQQGTLANIEEPQLYYRVHENQVSSKYFSEQYVISMAITREALLRLGVDMDPFTDKVVGFIAYPQRCFEVAELYQVELFMKEVIRVLEKNPYYDNGAVHSFMVEQLLKTLHRSQNIGLPLLRYIAKSDFVNRNSFDLKYFVKVILKRNTRSKPKKR